MTRLTIILVLLFSLPCWAANDFTGDPYAVYVATMDSNEPTGETIVYTAASTPERIFDDNASTQAWINPGTITVNWGGTESHVITDYTIVTTFNSGPTAWTVEGYDGSWHTLDTETSASWSGSPDSNDYSCDATGDYTQYRIAVTAATPGDWYFVEWRLFENDGVDSRIYFTDGTALGATLERGGLTNANGTEVFTLIGEDTVPPVDTTNKQEGTGSIDFENDEYEYALLWDDDAGATWPFKAGTSNYDFSVTCWIRPETVNSNYYYVWNKNAWDDGDTGHGLYILEGYARVVLNGSVGPYSLTATDAGLTAGSWSFIACTFEDATDTLRLYVYDLDSATITDNRTFDFAVATYGNPVCEESPWMIGGLRFLEGETSHSFDGNIDEFVIWNSALSVADINDVRDGSYVAQSASGNNDWWWRRRHNN